MYNSKSIRDFCNKVHKEAEEAAQAVYDKYNEELLTRIQNQIKEGDIIHVAMGVVVVNNKEGKYVGNKLSNEIARHYYTTPVTANFDLPYKFSKYKIIK